MSTKVSSAPGTMYLTATERAAILAFRGLKSDDDYTFPAGVRLEDIPAHADNAAALAADLVIGDVYRIAGDLRIVVAA